ncbi:hypothetical protein AB1Y20_014445 [Prymnesium parvum]|uniref:Uncharacterized protein n=1 Tax=Prymnesium parvum TaxID=97485 RepID=A0AB34IDQ6_PRYPA
MSWRHGLTPWEGAAAGTRRSGHTCTPLVLPADHAEVLLLFGGHDGHDVLHDTHAFLPRERRWRQLDPTGALPSPRALHSACALRTHVVVAFGWAGGGSGHADLCLLSVDAACRTAAWRRVVPPRAPVPSARWGHSAVARGEGAMLLFGGDVGGYVSAELWEYTLDGAAWARVEAAGKAPPPRQDHAAGVVGARGEEYMVVYGGRGSGGERLDDVYVLALGSQTWAAAQLAGDVPRGVWGAACCTLQNALLVDGGFGLTECEEEQLRFELVAEPSLKPKGGVTTRLKLYCQSTLRSGPAAPPPRFRHTAAAVGGEVYLVGGTLPNGEVSGDVLRVNCASVDWIKPVARKEEFKRMAGLTGVGEPELFHELIPPPLPESTHTATLCGDTLYVLSPPASGKGALAVHMMHTPTFSWRKPTRLDNHDAPRLSGGFTAALLPQECPPLPTLRPLLRSTSASSSSPTAAAATTSTPIIRGSIVRGVGSESFSFELHVLKFEEEDAPSGAVQSGTPRCWSQFGRSDLMAKLGDRWPYARCGHTATVLGGAPSTPRGTLAVEGMLVLGGLGTRPDYDEYSSHFLSDAFLLDVSGRKWQKLHPSGFMPRGRSLHAAVALETPTVRGGVRVAMFGGWCKGNGEVTRSFTIAEHKMLYLNDVHILTIERPSAADTPPECSWASLKPRGPAPSPRVSCACVATPRGLLLLGGTAHAGRTLGVAELQLDNGEAEWEEEEEGEASVVDAEAVVGGQAGERCKWVWLDESGSRPVTALGRLSATRVDGLVYLLFPSPPADDQPQPACVLVMDTGASRPSLRRELYLQRTREATLDKHAHAAEAACRSAFGTSSSGQRVPYKFPALGDLHDATERDDGMPPKRLLPSASFLSTSPRIEQLPKDQVEFPAPGAYGELSLERHSTASFESESDTAFHLSLLAPRQRSGATAARPIAQIRKCEGFRAYLAASGANHAPPASSYAAATSSRNAYTAQLTESHGAHELLLSPRDGVGRATLLHAHPAFQLPPDSPGPAAYSPQPPPLLAVAAHASFRSSSARIGYLPPAPPPLPPPPPPPPRRRPGKREHAAATRVAAAARGRAARRRLQQMWREAAATRLAAAARRRAARAARSRRAAAASKIGAAARGRAVRRRRRREAAAAARLQARQRGKSARARAARRREERRREGQFPLRIRVDQLPVAISIHLPPTPPPPKEAPPHCPTPPPPLHEGRAPRSHAATPRARKAEAPSLAWRWQPVGFASTEKRSWQRPTRTYACGEA